MTQPHSLRERLRRETEALHKQTEQRIDVEARFGALGDYRAYLARLYGIVIPLENLLQTAARGALLKSDLQDLELSQTEIDNLPHATLSLPGDADSIIGIKYVYDGSTLGGRVLLKQYATPLGINADKGGRYLAGGADAMAEWKQLVASLDGRSDTGDAADKAVEAATMTFKIFAAWLGR